MVSVATKWTGNGGGGLLYKTYMCNTYGDLFANNCNTIGWFGDCYWTNSWKRPLYIEETCYKGLTDKEKEFARGAGAGMVKDGIWKTFVRVEQYGNRYKFNPDAIIPYPEDDPCLGVVCDPVCIGADKYSQVCATEGENVGECIFDQLIEANSPDCPGYDPCKDVVCEPACDGYDLYETTCLNGVCIKGALIEANNRDICGYDPCRGVVCDDECYGVDKYSTTCDEGVCLPEMLLEPNSEDCGYIPYVCTDGQKRYPTTCWDGSVIHGEVCHNNAWVPGGETCPIEPGPCEGVVCDPTCVDDDLYATVCDNGVCIKGALIESDNVDICGYTPPDPDPTPDPDGTPWDMIVFAGVAVVIFYMFIRTG